CLLRSTVGDWSRLMPAACPGAWSLFWFTRPAPAEPSVLSLHDALPIRVVGAVDGDGDGLAGGAVDRAHGQRVGLGLAGHQRLGSCAGDVARVRPHPAVAVPPDLAIRDDREGRRAAGRLARPCNSVPRRT